MTNISYRQIKKQDHKLIEKFIRKHWGCEKVVVHSTEYFPADLDGFIALDGKKIVGLITYTISDRKCEIVTLDSDIENIGIGTNLIKLTETNAIENKLNSIWLITTNDNIRAIEFYQKRGYQLTEVFPNAVKKSRKIKPEIPEFADNGIPIRDELKFIKSLK